MTRATLDQTPRECHCTHSQLQGLRSYMRAAGPPGTRSQATQNQDKAIHAQAKAKMGTLMLRRHQHGLGDLTVVPAASLMKYKFK